MLTQFLKQKGNAAGAALLAMLAGSLAGCSANPHTIDPHQPVVSTPPSGEGSQKRQSETRVEPPAPVLNEAPVVAVPAGPEGIAGPSSADGLTSGVGAPAIETSTLALPFPPSPVAVDGVTGATGIAGESACGIVSFNHDFHAQRLTRAEISAVTPDLPYVSTGPVRQGRRIVQRGHQIAIRQIGQSRDTVCGERYVTNGQVLFKVDLNLPNFAAFRSLTEADLMVSVSKMVRGRGEANFMETEMLCLLGDVKKCSGHAMSAINWLANRSATFFGGEDPVVSDFFSRALIQDETRTRVATCRRAQVFSVDNANIDLQEALPGVDIAQALYSGTTESQEPYVSKTLYFVVADDTYVREATLNVQLQYDNCRVNELQRAVAR